jgi:hypothetical protein
VIRFESDEYFFNQPTEARYLIGFIDYLNEKIGNPKEIVDFIVMEKEANLGFFFNCLPENIEKVRSKPIGRRVSQISVS